LKSSRLVDQDWWREAVVYQIYPRSFADSNGDGIGDLAGAASRISYLSQLGIDAIWLSPFYVSPMVDGGYDIADHRAVDPVFGKLDDFAELVRVAHDHGIRVIVDLVPNHTSSQHPWFQEALATPPGHPSRGRYIFMDGDPEDPGRPPSNWTSQFGGSAWEPTEDGQWYLHLFDPAQPDLNWSHPDVRSNFITTIRHWAGLGVDGFRVDVAHGLAKDLTAPLRNRPDTLELPDDGSDPLYDRDELEDIYSQWNQVFRAQTPALMAVAEAWVPATRRARYASKGMLDQVFNFDLLSAPWRAATFREVIARNLAEAERVGSSSTWVLSNHDVIRHPTRYAFDSASAVRTWLDSGGQMNTGNAPRGLQRARAATALILALPGSSYLYQGEELGLPEVGDLPEECLDDPIWRRSNGQHRGRDGARVPLPWTSSGTSYGFGPAGAWLPQPSSFASLSVEAQQQDPNSTLAFYRRALRARRQITASAGPLTWLSAEEDDLLVFRRGDGWEIRSNFAEHPIELPPPAGLELVLSSSARPHPASIIPGSTTVWFVDTLD